MNTHFVEFAARERQAGFLREAQNQRLADLARSGRRWHPSQLLATLAGVVRGLHRSERAISTRYQDARSHPWLDPR